jgi:hypothetical protein
MQEMLADDVVLHLNGRGASVVHWAFGLCVALPWPQGELDLSPRPAKPVQQPQAELDTSPPPTESVAPPEPQAPKAKPGVVPQAARPQQHPDKVSVKVLERRDAAGKVLFFVQEEGKPRGVLAYGLPPPPEKLPQVGDEIAVYRNNRDPRSPQYRWDKPTAMQDRPQGRPGGRRPPQRR